MRGSRRPAFGGRAASSRAMAVAGSAGVHLRDCSPCREPQAVERASLCASKAKFAAICVFMVKQDLDSAYTSCYDINAA